MHRLTLFCSLTLAGALMTAPVFAGAMSLTLESGASNPVNLTVGEVIQVDVLFGNPGGLSLTALWGAVSFSDAIFGTPFNSVAGPIVPDPLDLVLTELPGTQDAFFFDVGGGNITSDGVFFSFQLTALAPGSGVIAFDPPTLFAEDDIDNFYFDFDIDVNQLSYVVTNSSVGVVPEPLSISLWLGLFGTILITRSRRTRS